jgi:hypothetical protein
MILTNILAIKNNCIKNINTSFKNTLIFLYKKDFNNQKIKKIEIYGLMKIVFIKQSFKKT